MTGPRIGAVPSTPRRRSSYHLSDADTARLVATLLGQAALPTETQAALLERAGGNPLYAEQVCRMLTDRGILTRDHRTAHLVPGAEVIFPESIQALITARLDALSHEQKTLLQDAAVVGKVFRADALAVTGQHDAVTIQDGLHHLARREFIRPVRDSSGKGEAEYAFWHVLTRDVAYAQLPRAARMRKHRAAAAWIEQTAGERVADHAEVLAHHYTTALALAEGDRGHGGGDQPPGACRPISWSLLAIGPWDSTSPAPTPTTGAPSNTTRPAIPGRPGGPGQAKVRASADDIVSPTPARPPDHHGKASNRWTRIPDPRAVADVDRVDLLLRAAEAASQSGDFRRAVDLAREAVAAIEPSTDPLRAALAHERLGQFLIDASPMKTGLEEILDVCWRAVELAPRDPPHDCAPGSPRPRRGAADSPAVPGSQGLVRRGAGGCGRDRER